MAINWEITRAAWEKEEEGLRGVRRMGKEGRGVWLTHGDAPSSATQAGTELSDPARHEKGLSLANNTKSHDEQIQDTMLLIM